MTTKLDPLLQNDNVVVEPEELLEPVVEHIKGRPSAFGVLRTRLSDYGNRVLGSGRRLLQITGETLSNIGTALAGSIIFLPILIVVRGISVLAHGLLDLLKPMLFSTLRALLELLRAIQWPLHELFINFNKRVLFPTIKRIKEDDTAAAVAFLVLLVAAGGIIFLLTRLF